jgi:hypothetical protein
VVDQADIALSRVLEQQVGDLILGENLFQGGVRAKGEHVPSEAVFVLLTGGIAPQASNGELTSFNRPVVQIRTRGPRLGYARGLERAIEVLKAAHYASVDGYVDVRVNESAPIYLGEDDDGHPEWSNNVTMWVVEAL